MRSGIILILFINFLHCVFAQSDRDVRELRDWMIGNFSSQEQAQRDTNFFDIRLAVYPIWKDRTDGYWLYVEQADARTPNEPYRQRIYQLTLTSRGIESIIYTFDDPLEFAGKPEEVETLSRTELTAREGCEVVIRRQDRETFIGSTVGKKCPSELRGASYATSKAIITKDKMITLDQGFNSMGTQVWGSTQGGYEFKKINQE
ncbi:chromophore lyase CpcT/CpeT [Oscillatoria amoena NRMC-F 0135]|nr:chromophore lyase CpcT/CpeT [Oscillatoria amoena NRMC-F 0135]